MVKLMRIDERLIHGQVVTGWSKLLSVNAIVVGNDKAANDTVISMTLKMAAPQGMKAAIKTVEGAIALLNDPRAKDMAILVIVDNPVDAFRIAKEVPGIPEINVGNFGRLNKEEKSRKTLSKGFFANDEEIAQFKELLKLGIPCNVQMTSNQGKERLEEVL